MLWKKIIENYQAVNKSTRKENISKKKKIKECAILQ